MTATLTVTTSGDVTLTIRALTDAQRAATPCDLCAIRRAELELTATNETGNVPRILLEPLRLCGDELAVALAVHLGRAHLDAGGSLADLRA